MNDYMRESLRKLALWYTKTFKPIMTHDELEPIMATLGFIGLRPSPAPNGVVWKEYVYTAGGCRGWLTSSVNSTGDGEKAGHLVAPPRPRLPYQRIDGLHIYTYRAFIDAVVFYLEMDDISELFHIRGMPLHRVHDRNKKFRRMDPEESIFVYREGSLDPLSYALYHVDKNSTAITSNENDGNALVIRNKDKTWSSVGTVVPLKDVIVIV
ncbi:hypothetical protein V2J09_016724 [Rumex salicifolius]